MMTREVRGAAARQLISVLARDELALRRTHGNRRVYRHPDRRRVIVAVHAPGDTVPAKTLASIIQSTGWSESDLGRLGLF